MKEGTNKGFTIIEFLVYVTILAIVINTMGGVALNVFRVGARTDAIQEVAHNGRFAMQKIGQIVKLADSVILPITEGSYLVLGFEQSIEDTTTFDVFEKTLRIKEGNKDYVDLTTSKVSVDNIKFTKVKSLTGRDSVKIEMNISFNNQKNLPEYLFENFITGVFTVGGK